MEITIVPGKLSGIVSAIPSKSQAHRLLICAAFADAPTLLDCPQTNRDIEATADCLCSLGAKILRTETGYHITPIDKLPKTATLNCCESGSTLRFMLPIVGALGIDATFLLEGRLPERPLSPLWEEMQRMGCQLSRPTPNTIRCRRQLRSGEFTISGNVSSQFITGLLFATALMNGESRITVTGKLESMPYVTMTQQAMSMFGVKTENFAVKGAQKFCSPGKLQVEGDWSNSAFWIAANALGCSLTVDNLNRNSPQGDRAAAQLLPLIREEHCSIDASDIPDLVPIMAVMAAASHGAVFKNIQRLRLKETDRVRTICAMLDALGATTQATDDTLTVFPASFHGGTVDAANDHRIAMSAAIAATIASAPVTILQAECVNKSYPGFWDEYHRLGGHYEKFIR
jgi:3-phosphoshikimate 1-carboxyvinyltransferase